jgi:hypothetical protein
MSAANKRFALSFFERVVVFLLFFFYYFYYFELLMSFLCEQTNGIFSSPLPAQISTTCECSIMCHFNCNCRLDMPLAIRSSNALLENVSLPKRYS